MRIAWVLLLGMAACEVRETDRPCPCADGWTCCEMSDTCVPEGSTCGANPGPGPGSASDGGAAQSMLGPQCELRCVDSASVLLEAPFEAGGLDPWTRGPDSTTASLVCDESAIEGECAAQVAGDGLALYQQYAPQGGKLLLRAWLRPVAVADGGGLFLRSELGSEDYAGFVLEEGRLGYRYIDNGNEAFVGLVNTPVDDWTCLRAVIDVTGPSTTVFLGVGTNTGSAYAPYLHGRADVLTTIELTAGAGNALAWDGLQLTSCE
jgi:hypothetical protein